MKTHTPHTPGPWNVERPFQEPGVYIAGPNTGLIAKLYEPDTNLYSGDKLVSIGGNARLIATAPDLLDALKSALDIMEGREAGSERVDAIAQARAAIARATGEKGGK